MYFYGLLVHIIILVGVNLSFLWSQEHKAPLHSDTLHQSFNRDDIFYKESMDLAHRYKIYIQNLFLESKKKANLNDPNDIKELKAQLDTHIQGWLSIESKLKQVHDLLYDQFLVEYISKRFHISLSSALGLYQFQINTTQNPYFPSLELNAQIKYAIWTIKNSLLLETHSIFLGLDAGYLLSFLKKEEQNTVTAFLQHQIYSEFFLGYNVIFKNNTLLINQGLFYFQIGLGPYLSLADIFVSDILVLRNELKLSLSIMASIELPIQTWCSLYSFIRYRFIVSDLIGINAGIGVQFSF